MIMDPSSSPQSVFSCLDECSDSWLNDRCDATFSMSSSLPLLPRCAAVHQYMGYCRWMLLTISETTSVRPVLKATSGRRYHPRRSTWGSTAANSAVAPAGGYIVFVTVIEADARPQARAPAIHRKFSKLGLRLKSFVTPMPTRAARICPMNAFRG